MKDERMRQASKFLAILLCLSMVAFAIVFFTEESHPSWSPALLAIMGAVLLAFLNLVRLEWRAKERAFSRESSRASLAERRLKGLREMIDELSDGLDTAIFVLDSKGNIEYANKSAAGLFKFDDPQGRSILAVSLSSELERIVLEASRSGATVSTELRFGITDERHGMARAWPESGEDPRVFLSIYDITDLRRLERVRQDFVANVSHELRTPMSTVRAMAETLEDLSEPDPVLEKRYLGKIIAEIDRLTSIVDDLLMLSSAESTEVMQGSANVAEVAMDVVRQLEKRANAKKIKITTNLEKDVFSSIPYERLTQVALNLVDNAIKYTMEGSIIVEVRSENSQAVLSVTDSGLGISSENVSRIFERFYRVDKGRSRASGGTGLGLSIVRHLVESYGGSVQVVSELNKGSTFTVILPLLEEPESPDDFPALSD